MAEVIELTFKSSITDRYRKLTITPDYLEFDDKDEKHVKATKFLKEETEGIQYGISWIGGYMFYIGRIYCVDVKDKEGRVIKIRLKSLYGIRRKQLAEKYALIVNSLFDLYFDEVSRTYLQKFSNKESFNLLGIDFSQEGVRLSLKDEIIPWSDLGTKSYQTYYAMFSKANPRKYKAFEYLKEWNTGILYSV